VGSQGYVRCICDVKDGILISGLSRAPYIHDESTATLTLTGLSMSNLTATGLSLSNSNYRKENDYIIIP